MLDTTKYTVVNGTSYHKDTPNQVITILERYRNALRQGSRLVIEYGDNQTGESWGDHETGYIGRSAGNNKIPLVIHNARSMGGPALLDHCIVRISTAQGKHILYTHPTYKPVAM